MDGQTQTHEGKLEEAAPMILIGWIALMLFGVAVCRMAARSDAAHSDAASDPGRAILRVLMGWEDEPQEAIRNSRELSDRRR
jgi:hypothetical protein